MSPEPARMGVPVWRGPSGNHFYSEAGSTIFRSSDEPGLWFATTPEAVAELRDVMVAAMRAKAPTGGYEIAYADAVLRAMGFTDA